MWATRLDQLKYWFSLNEVPLWVEIEKSMAPIPDLQVVLLGDNWIPWDMKTIPPTINISLQAWRFLLTRQLSNRQVIVFKLPLSIIEANIPMLSLKTFPSQGINTVQDLLINNCPKTTECLMREFNMPNQLLLTCI